MEDLSNTSNGECNNLPQWPISPEELESIIQLHTNVIGILKKGLCSKELVERIIKDFERNDERQSILEDINSHDIKIDEEKYETFKSHYAIITEFFWEKRTSFIYPLLTTKKNLDQIKEFLRKEYRIFREFLWNRYPQK